MRVLLVDVGNSHTRLALWEGRPAGGAPLPPAGRFERLSAVATPHDVAGREALATRLAESARDAGCFGAVLVSVVPDCDAALLAALPPLIRIDHRLPLPFTNGVADPAAVGADRYANVAAAVARGWQAGLIVDAGTATTIDLLLAGVFAGGLIVPGMALAAERLAHEAARLSPVPFEACPLEVGRTTADAMRAGAFHAGVLGIVGVVEALREKFGPLPVAVTGGLGVHLQRPGWLFDRDWTLRGALVLAWPRLRPRDASDTSP